MTTDRGGKYMQYTNTQTAAANKTPFGDHLLPKRDLGKG